MRNSFGAKETVEEFLNLLMSFLSSVGNRWYEITYLFECCDFGCHCVGLK